MNTQIFSKKNIEDAYFELVEKLDLRSKSNVYTGIDGLTLNDFDFSSEILLRDVEEELKELRPIVPAMKFKIDKKGGGERIIYIYSIKERIKAQAIYRVLEPFFESLYSPFLFSYRSSSPSFYAAKTVAKRYKKNFALDTIYRGDISDYTENIDQEILKMKLLKTGLPSDVLKLLHLFIDNSYVESGKIVKPEKGVIQGVPVITFFANLYLNDADHYVGKKVALYRRVGDDFIMFDKDKAKVSELRKYLKQEAKSLGLQIKDEKEFFARSDRPFNFLGYQFKGNKVSIGSSSIKKAERFWKHKLKFYPISDRRKLFLLKKILFEDVDSIDNQFVQFIASYKQSTDKQQIKKLSEKFYRILTKYFFEKYSARNQRLTKELLKEIKVPSLYQYYLDFHNGKKSITELSVSKKGKY